MGHRYIVDCYTDSGFCYRTITNCDWEGVKNLRNIARILGETIKYERMKNY